VTAGGPLSAAEVGVLDAAVRRIFPGDAADPGAAEAGVLTYLTRALAGPERGLLELYRAGIAGLDRRAVGTYGAAFAELPDSCQDALLAELDAEFEAQLAAPAQAGPDADPAAAEPYFFAVLCEHTLQGMFADPGYGGNRDGAGWRLIGFPGSRWGYSAAEMATGFDASALPLSTLADLGQVARRREV
jgi:gluconate 2-dehydrogenase gamma chain